MVRTLSSLVALAALLSQVSAAPMIKRDSAIGAEVAVSASGGVVMSATQMMDAMAATTTMMDQATNTYNAYAQAATTTAYAQGSNMYGSGSSNMYGSGSSTWGGQGYNNCVQQCMATYGMPAATYTAAAVMETAATATSTEGSGTTHTIIVAPTQGVLRFIPFATNASVGDTVRFVWGAGPHTVTQSSILNPCNETSAPGAFNSGKQNKSFIFDQVINNTDPTFFYCGIPTHCQKGMFGIINPPAGPSDSSSTSSAVSNTTNAATVTVGSWLSTQAQNDSSVAAMWNYVSNQTMGTSAYGWGSNIDMTNMPASQYASVAQNAMYTSLFFAENPGMLEAGMGASDVSGKGINIPADISVALAQMTSGGYDSSNASSSGAIPTATGASSAATTSGTVVNSAAKTNGSGRLVSSTALVGAIALLASFVTF